MKCKVMCVNGKYKYKLWAWTYSDGNGDYNEWHKIVYTKNKLTKEQQEQLSGKFADELAYKHYCNINLYGCREIVE